jgi:hypothetical protein
MMTFSELKHRARQAFASQRAMLIISYVVLIALTVGVLLIQQLVTNPGDVFFRESFTRTPDATAVDILNQSLTVIADRAAVQTAPLATVLSVVISLGLSVLSAGYSYIMLRGVDGQVVSITDLFMPFKRFGRWFTLALLTFARVFLWTLLFIIPGIVVAFGYSQAVFIMLDDPEISPADALKKSTALMRGHKGELFCLQLSFILWQILTLLTLGLASLYVDPYYNLTLAVYYRNLSRTGPGGVALSSVEGSVGGEEVLIQPEVSQPDADGYGFDS